MLKKFVSAERRKYYVGHLVLSGTTCDTRQGRLINDEKALFTAEKSVRALQGGNSVRR